MMTHVLKKFSGGGATLTDFLHVGVRGVWLNVQREFRPGKKFSKLVSKKLEFGHLKVKGENDDDDPRAEKIFRRWCQFAQFFPCRGEGCLAKCAA